MTEILRLNWNNPLLTYNDGLFACTLDNNTQKDLWVTTTNTAHINFKFFFFCFFFVYSARASLSYKMSS